MTVDYTRVQSLLSSVWPEWRVTRRLGKGSYGAVYEIIRDDLGSGYKCALKVLEMESDETALGESITVQAFTPHSSGNAKPKQQSLDPWNPDSLSDSLPAQEEEYHQKTSLKGTLLTSRKTASNFQGIPLESQSDILEEFVRGVSREIDLMMQLKGSPNIVSIEDYTVLRGKNIRTILIRMELLQGVDSIAEINHGMNRRDVIRLGTDICSALTRCEEKHVLHRDIKPSNLFYSENGGYKLGDFGISRTMASIHEKMSMSGIGTVQYMAPEVYFGEKYNNTIDIYSLGLTLYQLLNRNRPPLYEPEETEDEKGSGGSGGTNQRRKANMRRLRGEPLPPPEFADDRLAAAILKACDPDPSKRFQRASEFRDALLSCQSDSREPSPVPGPGPGEGHSPRPRILYFAAIFLFLLAAILFFLFRPGGTDKTDTVSYTILCQDENGEIIRREDLQGKAGETITYTAESVEGYTVENSTKDLYLSEDEEENILIFIYKKEDTATAETEISGTADTSPVSDAGPVETNEVDPEQEPEAPDLIQWSDSGLEAAVKRAAGLSGDITAAQAARITELTLDASDLHSIDGLQYFTGLKTLSLADNFIKDVTPLAGLTALHELNLEKNYVEDVTPLSGLTSLRRLDLYQNRVSDISALKGMTKLNMLDLRENNVSDLSACAGMHAMEELYVSTNKSISDISPLAGMTSLYYLGLKNTNVSDISALSKADALSTLVLANTRVTSLAPIRNLPKLAYLDIRGCYLKETSTLEQLRKKSGLKILE